MIKNKLLRNIDNLIKSIKADPLTFKKAILLCLYAMGFRLAAEILTILLKLYTGIIPDLIFTVIVLVIARDMGKNEMKKIFIWRDVPLVVFAAVLVMFYGFNIIRSELRNIVTFILPLAEGARYDSVFIPKNLILFIISHALLPAFSEEIFFRGIIARRFYRTYSLRKAVLLSAVLFGLIHMNPWQAINAFIGGIFYGWIYWRYHSIWLCMFLHAYSNALVSLMPLPYVEMTTIYYDVYLRHPLWLDILGVLLFGFGLLTVIVVSRKKANEQLKIKNEQ